MLLLTSETPRRKPALVVDHDEQFRRSSMQLLNAIGLSPVGFAFPEAALAWLEMNRAPVIACLDGDPPTVNAVRLCSAIRTLHGYKVRVLIVARRDEPSHRMRMIEAGGDAFLSKASSRGDFVSLARALLDE